MKVTKDYLKEIIKKELSHMEEAGDWSEEFKKAKSNPFIQLEDAKKNFKYAMELCNINYSHPDYKRFSAIKRAILEGIVSCDFLIEALEYKGAPLNKSLRPILPSDKIIQPKD
jgi:hypothetical protein